MKKSILTLKSLKTRVEVQLLAEEAKSAYDKVSKTDF